MIPDRFETLPPMLLAGLRRWYTFAEGPYGFRWTGNASSPGCRSRVRSATSPMARPATRT